MSDIGNGEEEGVNVSQPPKNDSYHEHFHGMYDDQYIQSRREEMSFRIGQVFGDFNLFRATIRDYAVKGDMKLKD